MAFQAGKTARRTRAIQSEATDEAREDHMPRKQEPEFEVIVEALRTQAAIRAEDVLTADETRSFLGRARRYGGRLAPGICECCYEPLRVTFPSNGSPLVVCITCDQPSKFPVHQ